MHTRDGVTEGRREPSRYSLQVTPDRSAGYPRTGSCRDRFQAKNLSFEKAILCKSNAALRDNFPPAESARGRL